jgi:hypothetical protein
VVSKQDIRTLVVVSKGGLLQLLSLPYIKKQKAQREQYLIIWIRKISAGRALVRTLVWLVILMVKNHKV